MPAVILVNEMALGGSPDMGFGHQVDGTYFWANSRPARVNWDAIPSTYGLRGRIWSRVEDAGASMLSGIYNITDAAIAGVGSPVTATSFQADGSEEVIAIPRPAGNGVKYYRGQSALVGAAAKNVWSYGFLEPYLL